MELTMKAARVNAGYTQKTAAKLLKISNNTLSSYENYKTIPDVRISKRMAKLYKLSVNDIIFYKERHFKCHTRR